MTVKNILRHFCLLSITTFFLNCEAESNQKLRIATAANMQFAMEEIVNAFEQETGIECQMIVSSSGKLSAQIQEGAPFDVFVSADLKYPKQLFEADLTLNEPKVYAHGKLVLWSAKKMDDLSLDDWQSSDIQNIVLANPKIAPYGLAAMEVLKNYALLEKVETKLVYGESISQTNQFILSGAASLGFTAKSVVLSPKMRGKGSWVELADSTYSPIQQAVVILKNNAEKQAQAKQFCNYLFASESQEILEGFGYETIKH
ncbi:MAG: molybdate ABC transporter substrate-binding protein [Bacteroidota bacterium]